MEALPDQAIARVTLLGLWGALGGPLGGFSPLPAAKRCRAAATAALPRRQDSRTQDPRPKTQDPRPKTQDPRLRTKAPPLTPLELPLDSTEAALHSITASGNLEDCHPAGNPRLSFVFRRDSENFSKGPPPSNPTAFPRFTSRRIAAHITSFSSS